MKRILCWHFAADDLKLGYRDGRKIQAGRILSVEGTPELCLHGMHGSRTLLNALDYANGSQICRCEVWGQVDKGSAKLCGTHRKTLWIIDGTNLLHEFACRCAEDALALADNPDSRSVRAIEVKRLWVRGLATRAELAAARAAARDAAWDAARAAARAAAWDAARAAAWDAAWNAARDAAWAAARDAARDAAWAVQSRRLAAMVSAEHKRAK